MSTPTEYGARARHLLHSVTFKNTCNENISSNLHVIIHGYIITVLDGNIYVYMINIDYHIYIYIYIYNEYLLNKYFCRNMK